MQFNVHGHKQSKYLRVWLNEKCTIMANIDQTVLKVHKIIGLYVVDLQCIAGPVITITILGRITGNRTVKVVIVQ